MPLTANRKVTVSEKAKRQGRYPRVTTLEQEAMQAVTVYLDGVAFPLRVSQHVFTNEEGSTETTDYTDFADSV